MDRMLFAEPVWIFSGLGNLREVRSAGQAFMVLSELPPRRCDADHDAALAAAKLALSGAGPLEAAREAFADYAAKRGILAPAMESVLAAQAAGAGFAKTGA